MSLVIVRLEGGLKSIIEKISVKTDRNRSEIARVLIRIGLGVRKAGGIFIEGPFELRRPLSSINFGEEKERIGFRIDKNLMDELRDEFSENLRDGIRGMMRVGAFMLVPDQVKVVGPLGFEQPLASVIPSEIEDERAQEELEKLQDRLK